jgi:23S rRNA pseudouridine2457 synthase
VAADPTLIRFWKPFGVLSQFSGESVPGRQTLRDYIDLPGFYPAGRLDLDSEGLLLLTSSGALQHRLAHPRFHLRKTYLVQVEGTPSPEAVQRLCSGVALKDGPTLPAHAVALDAQPNLPPRIPPVRFRKSIPTSWLELTITEGRNRQIRRMTAAVGLPTLRLVRTAIGPASLSGLNPGEWAPIEPAELNLR